MNSKIRALCTVSLPYPRIGAGKPDRRCAGMVMVPYIGQGGELASVMQYHYSYLICRRRRLNVMADVFACIAETELTHMNLLGDLIFALDGVPDFRFADARGRFAMLGDSPERLLAAAISGEERSIRGYRRLIETAENPAVTEMAERIILDEERHLAIFRKLLSERGG